MIIAAFVPVLIANAAPAGSLAHEGVPFSVPTLDQSLASLLSLGGFAALVTCIINAGKTFKVIPDGQAPAVSLFLNLSGLIALVTLQVYGKSDLVPVIDANVGSFSQALTLVLALVYQLYISRVAHTDALAGVPVIGTSHSGRKAGESFVAELVQMGE